MAKGTSNYLSFSCYGHFVNLLMGTLMGYNSGGKPMGFTSGGTLLWCTSGLNLAEDLGPVPVLVFIMRC